MTFPAEVWRSLLTPQSFLDRSAAVFPERTAVVYGTIRRPYRELTTRVNRLANALRTAGVQKGDRVAFLCPNTPPLLEAHFAVPLAGGALVAINTRLSADEIHYILGHSGARILFVDAELAHLVAARREELDQLELVCVINDDQIEPVAPVLEEPDYEAFLADASPAPLTSLLVTEEDIISINYTSGTTGQPKGVMYTHRGAYLNALGECLEVGFTSDGVYLWTLPMFHCNGWCFPWGVVAMGGTQVCLRRLEPEAVIRLVRDERVSHFCAAPTVLIMMLNHPAIADLQLRRPLTVVTAAAPPSPTVIQAVEELGARIIHVYGLTETYGPHSICEWNNAWDDLSIEQRARLNARQGVPYIHAAEMRVVDDDFNDVPADAETLGEVIMRGNNVMLGYFDDPEATARAFRGGWFHSGDLAVVHPDGYIELRDRLKDIIISGGENISTIEVERAIYQHPAVLEVAVIAIPDPLWGEVPKAFVTLKRDATLTEEDLIAFCRERLARFKCPKAVAFGELPKTSTGKIQKFRLREQEWASVEKRIN